MKWFKTQDDTMNFMVNFCTYAPTEGLARSEQNQIHLPKLMNMINGHYQSNEQELRDKMPNMVRDTWEQYAAMAVDWWWDERNHPQASPKTRRRVAILGGCIVDYMSTELTCRARRWIKQCKLCNLCYPYS